MVSVARVIKNSLSVNNSVIDSCVLDIDETGTTILRVMWFFPKNGGIHFYHNVQAFNVDSRSTLKA